jgi:hypothetical protein
LRDDMVTAVLTVNYADDISNYYLFT